MSTNPPPAPRPSEIKIRQPEDFDGDISKVEKFLQDVQLYLSINSQIYSTDTMKQIFLLSFCTKGTARAFAEDWYTLNKHTTGTFQNLVDAIKKAFYSSDIEGEALQDLKRIKQTGTANDYVSRFRILASKAKITDERTLKDLFLHGLSDGLRNRLFALTTMPADMDAWYAQAVAQDNQWRQYQTYTRDTPVRRPFPRREFPARTDSTLIKKSTTALIRNLPVDDLTDELFDEVFAARLSTSERERYFKNKLCFRCGKPGHVSRNCKAPRETLVTKSATTRTIRAIYDEQEPDDLSLDERTAFVRQLLTGATDEEYNHIVDSIADSMPAEDTQDDGNFREI